MCLWTCASNYLPQTPSPTHPKTNPKTNPLSQPHKHTHPNKYPKIVQYCTQQWPRQVRHQCVDSTFSWKDFPFLISFMFKNSFQFWTTCVSFVLARKGGLEFSRLVPSLTILILPSGRFKDKEAENLQKNLQVKKEFLWLFENLILLVLMFFLITVEGWQSVFCAFFNSASLPLM